jgi:hypothetical protein
MADQIVVRYGADGSVTVCFDARCVVVDCKSANSEEAASKPTRKPPKPPHRVLLRTEAFADVEAKSLEWEETEAGTRTAIHNHDRLWITRLDD